jgi:hypothetical protein
VPIEAVQERLELLLALDVPCEVAVASPFARADVCRVIRRVERQDGYFILVGDNFSFHMNEQCIQAACVATPPSADGAGNFLELRAKGGRLCARISCPFNGMAAAAWRDVLDSFLSCPPGLIESEVDTAL